MCLKQIAVPYVDGEALYCFFARYHATLTLYFHALLGVGKKSQIAGKVEDVRLFLECPLDSIPLLIIGGLHDLVYGQQEQEM